MNENVSFLMLTKGLIGRFDVVFIESIVEQAMVLSPVLCTFGGSFPTSFERVHLLFQLNFIAGMHHKHHLEYVTGERSLLHENPVIGEPHDLKCPFHWNSISFLSPSKDG